MGTDSLKIREKLFRDFVLVIEDRAISVYNGSKYLRIAIPKDFKITRYKISRFWFSGEPRFLDVLLLDNPINIFEEVREGFVVKLDLINSREAKDRFIVFLFFVDNHLYCYYGFEWFDGNGFGFIEEILW